MKTSVFVAASACALFFFWNAAAKAQQEIYGRQIWGGAVVPTAINQPVEFLADGQADYGYSNCSSCNASDQGCELGCGCGPSHWVALDMTHLNRNEGRFVNYAIQGNVTILNVNTLDFDPEVGYRLAYVRDLGNCLFEAAYQGGNQWHTKAVYATGNDNLNVNINPLPPGGLDDYVNSDAFRADYNTEFHNLEGNWIFPHTQSFSYLLGLRFFNLDETFNLRTYDDGFPTTPTGVSDYNIETENYLFGLQGGASYSYRLGYGFLMDINLKAGALINFAQSKTLLRDDDNTTIEEDNDDHTAKASFIGQVDLLFTYAINDHWGLRAGYQVLWATNVALASENFETNGNNLGTNGNPRINANGTAYYDGLFFGLYCSH